MKVRDMGGGITRVYVVVENPDDTHDTAILAYVRRIPKQPMRRVGVERGMPRK